MAVHKTVHKRISKLIPLGIILYKDSIGILERTNVKSSTFHFSWTTDGGIFENDTKRVVFSNGIEIHKPQECSNFRFSYIGKKIFATYTRIVGKNKYNIVAELKTIYRWETLSEILLDSHSYGGESILLDEKINKKYTMYEGGIFTRCLQSEDLEEWNDDNTLLFTSRHDRFDKGLLRLLGSIKTKSGTMLLYDAREKHHDKKNGNSYTLYLGGVLFDKDNPRRIIRRANNPLWKSDIQFGEDSPCIPLGTISHKNSLYIFWSNNDELIVVHIDDFSSITHIFRPEGPQLSRHSKNPIIKPHSKYLWKNEAIFNPTALYDEDKVHILYRAVGSDGISRIGYDCSEDGIHFKDSMEYPVFVMENPRKDAKKNKSFLPQRYDPVMYASGGSWGGAEDPRMVKIGKKIYVTFNAFDGWDFIRVCVISIDEKDFKKKNWKWSAPLLISSPREINKNWVLFPEKINGKFAILHNIWPKMGIEYVDSLEDLAEGKHKVPKFWDIGGRKNMPKSWISVHDGTPGHRWVDPKHYEKNIWKTEDGNNWDTWIRSAGPPPVKTDKGWLILYHAMDENERHIGYKLGAMLLDLKDPEKVLARSKAPILSPEKWYENEWKFGVVYACGAIIKDRTLFVYYGGGDKHVCVATINIDELLGELLKK